MAQTKPKAAQFYGVSGNGTAGQVLISDGNGGMSWGANTELFTISWNTPTGQGLTYTQPSPQSSEGTAGSAFPTTTFTVTKSDTIISGTATIAGLPTGITATQVITGSGIGNTLTVTLSGVFPGVNSLNTDLTLSGLTLSSIVSWATPTGQSLTYTQPSPQSSTGNPGTTFPTTTFTATKSGEVISGTATIAGLPTGITATQSLSGTGANNILTVTLAGVFPGADSLNTALTLSGLAVAVPLVVDYLVVAGGGGSPSSGTNGAGNGGGGAGGLRTSWPGGSGGGGNSEPQAQLTLGVNYTITIGAGGSFGWGSDSTFHNITSDGGGGGSPNPGSNTQKNGGSGGGAGGAGGAVGSATSPVQGYDGGLGSSSSSSYTYNSGGGGGAGGAGTAGTAARAGNGGIGLAVNIISTTNASTASVGDVSGSDVYFASGGAGGAYDLIPGTASVGGGGDGVTYAQGAPNNGSPNTGGGAGGTSNKALAASYGGSGVVILRYPSGLNVTGLSQANGSPFTQGTSKVSVFTTAGTGTIQFN